MTEREFQSLVLAEYRSEDTFNYVFVVVFFALGFYWLFDMNLTSFDTPRHIVKNILKVLAGVLPILFAISMLKGMTLGKKVITIKSDATDKEKQSFIIQYLDKKPNCKEMITKNDRIDAVEYSSRFGIPICFYSYVDDAQILLLIRRRDDFSIKEVFDFGLTYRSQKRAKQYLEDKLSVKK